MTFYRRPSSNASSNEVSTKSQSDSQNTIAPSSRSLTINFLNTAVLGLFSLIYLAFFCYCLFYAGLTMREILILKQLQHSGSYIEGTVMDTSIDYLPKGGRIFKIKYQFTVNGQTFTRATSVSGSYFQNAASTHSVAVHFTPGNPNRNRLDGEEGPNQTMLILLLMLGVYSIALFPYAALFRKELGLSKIGLISSGKITDIQDIQIIGKLGYVQIDYEFQDASRIIYNGQLRKNRGYSGMNEGQNVQILYDPKQPQLNCYYPMTYFRLE